MPDVVRIKEVEQSFARSVAQTGLGRCERPRYRSVQKEIQSRTPNQTGQNDVNSGCEKNPFLVANLRKKKPKLDFLFFFFYFSKTRKKEKDQSVAYLHHYVKQSVQN